MEVSVAVIGVVLGVGLAAAVTIWLVAYHWPQVDPTAPRIGTGTIEDAVGRWRRARLVLRTRLDPTRTTGFALTVAVVVVIGGALGVGLILVMLRTNTALARWDRGASEWGARHATSMSTHVLRTLTQLGGTLVVVVVSVAVAAVETRRTRRGAVVGFLTAVLLGVTVIVNVTKWLVDRSRPNVDRLVGFSGPSFPSGHAATSAAVYAAVALSLGRGRSLRTKQALAAAAAAVAVSVAATRVMLGVHWVTDVVAGVAIGWAWFALCSIAFGGGLLRFGAPVELAEQEAERNVPPTSSLRRSTADERPLALRAWRQLMKSCVGGGA